MSRHLVALAISPELLMARLADCLPSSAKYVRTRYDAWHDQVQIIVDDASFPETPDGGEPCVIRPRITVE